MLLYLWQGEYWAMIFWGRAVLLLLSIVVSLTCAVVMLFGKWKHPCANVCCVKYKEQSTHYIEPKRWNFPVSIFFAGMYDTKCNRNLYGDNINWQGIILLNSITTVQECDATAA